LLNLDEYKITYELREIKTKKIITLPISLAKLPPSRVLGSNKLLKDLNNLGLYLTVNIKRR
jgi:hypothetical protein